MAAPTPVSAYLHSATMVKAGVFLMGIMLPVLGNTAAWSATLTIAGGTTLLLGGLFGIRQTDLKKILAGTTLAILGMLTLLLGIGSEKAVLAAVLVMAGHALYKATLFMVAGTIDHETGTRDTGLLGGLRSAMPFTALAGGLAALSKMGIPPLYGFLGKEYAYKSTLAAASDIALTAVLLSGSAILFALALRTGFLPFWRKECGTLPKSPHEAPLSMLAGPLLLAVMGLALGAFPTLLSPLVTSACSAVLGSAVEPEVKLWTGFNLPLLLSGATLVLGLVIFHLMAPIRRVLESPLLPSTERAYDRILGGTLSFARWQTRILQSGYLRNYLIIIILATGALIISKLIRFGGFAGLPQGHDFSPTGVVIVTIMMMSVWLAVTAKTRLGALISLGTIGYGVAIIFAMFSAPDLAITQILVETLTVVLFAWVVHKLPKYRALSSKRSKVFDATIAVLSGTVITVLVLKSSTLNLRPGISDTLAEMSLPLAHGANVVNVILVDFRALDTLGEVCVLAIAALGAWALLGKPPASNDGQGGVLAMPRQSTPLTIANRYLGPILVVLSLVALYRGHNLPGGGFIGGLIAASAVLLKALTHGWEDIRKKLPVEPMTLIIIGLAVAMASGLPAILKGEPYMTGLWLPALEAPLIGKIKLGTPFLFDIGVYLGVVGFTLKCAVALGLETESENQPPNP